MEVAKCSLLLGKVVNQGIASGKVPTCRANGMRREAVLNKVVKVIDP